MVIGQHASPTLRACIHCLAAGLVIGAGLGTIEILAALSYGFYPRDILLAYGAFYLTLGIVCALGAALVGWATARLRGSKPAPPMERFAWTGGTLFALIVLVNYSNYYASLFPSSLALRALSLVVTGWFFWRWAGAAATGSPSRPATATRWPAVALVGIGLVVWLVRLLTEDAVDHADWWILTAGALLWLTVLSIWIRWWGVGARSAAATVLTAAFFVYAVNAFSAREHGNTVLQTATKPGNTASTPIVDHPPVILIVLDTVRADHVGCYGYGRNTTPALDRFAQDALLFEHAWSTSSWTLPAHASLFTGTFTTTHGAHCVRQGQGGIPPLLARPLDRSLPTLAEMLGQDGYETAAFVGNFAFASRDWGFARGFSLFDDRRRMSKLPTGILAEFLCKRFIVDFEPRFLHRLYRDAREVLGQASDWMTDHRDDPFFVFVNVMDPHDPYMPPDAQRKQFGARWARASSPREEVVSRQRHLDPEERQNLIDLYDGEIRYVDLALEQFFQSLRQLDLYDRSLIVITSDHGEAFEEHEGYVAHGYSLYQEETAIPLLVKLPGSTRSGTLEYPVQLHDIMPTVLRVAGVNIPGSVQGKDLEEGDHPIAMELHLSERAVERYGPHLARDLRATVFPGSGDKVILSDRGILERYELDTDPAEHDNRATATDSLVVLARIVLSEILQPVYGFSGESNIEVREGLEERLRALGYVQ